MRRRGLHPYKITEADFNTPIWQASLPADATVPLLQHEGDPAISLVAVGDQVSEGMLIGKSADGSGTGIHSPIPGTVDDIRDIVLPDGRQCKAVHISLKGQFEYLGKEKAEYEWEDLSPLALIDSIAQKGVVHLDGFGEPLGEMLRDMRKYGAESTVINALSGTPYITTEVRLLSEQPEAILTGARIIARILSTNEVWLMAGRSQHKHIQKFVKQARKAISGFHYKAEADSYPGGDPHELIHRVSKRELLPGASFKDSPTAVFSVSTLFAVYEAVVHRKALLDRLITVGGQLLGKSRTIRVRIGTTLNAVFDELGGLQTRPDRILLGNPLQGYQVVDGATPVTKLVTGIMVLSEADVGGALRMPCTNCGICVDACPADLEPVVLHKLLKQNRLDDARDAGLDACRVCGVCSHVCPSHIPLTTIMRDGLIQIENAQEGGTADAK